MWPYARTLRPRRQSDGPFRKACHWRRHSGRSFTSKKQCDDATPTTNKELVARMQSRLSEANSIERKHSSEQLGAAWEELWQETVTPWDLGAPTPALQSEIALHLNEAANQPFRTLVPGCGAGYDLVTLARHYEQCWGTAAAGSNEHHAGDKAVVVGLDVSRTSLERASSVIKSGFGDDLPTNTRVDLVQGDFFGNDTSGDKGRTLFSFGGRTGSTPNSPWDIEPFDFIFDYTFFVALPPTLRFDWGRRIAELLRPGTGRLLTLMFPLVHERPTILEGPPFPVTIGDYRSVLEPHDVIMEDNGPRMSDETVPPRKGKELVCWWRHGQS